MPARKMFPPPVSLSVLLWESSQADGSGSVTMQFGSGRTRSDIGTAGPPFGSGRPTGPEGPLAGCAQLPPEFKYLSPKFRATNDVAPLVVIWPGSAFGLLDSLKINAAPGWLGTYPPINVEPMFSPWSK